MEYSDDARMDYLYYACGVYADDSLAFGETPETDITEEDKEPHGKPLYSEKYKGKRKDADRKPQS